MIFLRRYGTGILPRYVMGQVAKAFFLAVTTLTSVFVLVIVVAKAAEAGLGPREIVALLPFAVPSTLPYTAPVALLFAVTVVYGRIASDQEILAAKAAGLSVLTVLTPTLIFGAVLSLGLLSISNEAIPRANHHAKAALLRNIEDMLYRVLAKERSFDNKGWPFKIEVDDVEDRTLIGARFSHRNRDPAAEYPFDMHVFAERASIHFEEGMEAVIVELSDAIVIGDAKRPDYVLIDNERLQIPLPGDRDTLAPPVQELTTAQILREQKECVASSEGERRRQASVAALWIASGRPRLVDWPHIRAAFVDYTAFETRYRKLETEKQMRSAIAFSPLFFVMLGAPVGIWRARGDYMSAFIICFLPIILIYYPLTLAGINVGKEGIASPMLALWLGNAVLAVLSGFVLRAIMRN